MLMVELFAVECVDDDRASGVWGAVSYNGDRDREKKQALGWGRRVKTMTMEIYFGVLPTLKCIIAEFSLSTFKMKS